MQTTIIVLALILFGGVSLAQQNPSGRESYQMELSPEVAAYNSHIESFYRVMELLVDRPEDLQRAQLTSLHRLREQLKTMQANVQKDMKAHPAMDAFVAPLAKMAEHLDQADKLLSDGKTDAASQSLKQAFAIATVLYKKPVTQLVVAEQKTDSAVKLMKQKRYQDAVLVLDRVIERLSRIKVPKGADWADELAATKSKVQVLRMQASGKTSDGGNLDKVAKAIEKSFNETHESVYGGVWTGPMNMQKLR